MQQMHNIFAKGSGGCTCWYWIDKGPVGDLVEVVKKPEAVNKIITPSTHTHVFADENL